MKQSNQYDESERIKELEEAIAKLNLDKSETTSVFTESSLSFEETKEEGKANKKKKKAAPAKNTASEGPAYNLRSRIKDYQATQNKQSEQNYYS